MGVAGDESVCHGELAGSRARAVARVCRVRQAARLRGAVAGWLGFELIGRFPRRDAPGRSNAPQVVSGDFGDGLHTGELLLDTPFTPGQQPHACGPGRSDRVTEQVDVARLLTEFLEARERQQRVAPEGSCGQRQLPGRRAASFPLHAQPRPHALAHALQHPCGGRLQLLAGGGEFAGSARGLGQVAQHGLCRGGAHADHEHAVAAAAGALDHAARVPDLAVGDEEHVGSARRLAVLLLQVGGQGKGGQQRLLHLGAAQVGMGARDGLLERAPGGGRAADRGQDRGHGRAEAGEAHLVGFPQAGRHALQGPAGGGDAVARHRARAVHEELEGQRGRFLLQDG